MGTRVEENLKQNQQKDIIASMFLPAAIVMIFSMLTGVVANIIDGVITSRYLGHDAYSAVSLLGPMVNIILLLASFISIGGQIVCSHKIGKGERQKANAVFTFSVVFGLGIAALFLLVCIFAPEVLFRICGIRGSRQPEIFEHMLKYMKGYIVGIPAVILVQILSPYMVMDNGKKLITISAVVLCVSDVTGDLLNIFVFHGNIFGMGLATSVSIWLQLAVLATHFVRKKGYFRFSLETMTFGEFGDIVKCGSVSFVKKLAVIIRDIATNRINLVVAVSTAAVAAKGMQSDLNMLMFCISIGIGRTLLTVSSMYYGASDKEGLKRSFTYAIKLCVKITLVAGAILFFAAPFIAGIYTSDPEVTRLSVFSIRCMALGLSLDGITEIYQDYLLGIQNRKMVNILCFVERLFVPIITAAVLGKIFGSEGIMAAVAVGKVILILGMFLYLCIRNHGIPKHTEDYMFLEKGFGGRKEDNIDAHIYSMEDVAGESMRAWQFCLEHGVSARQARLMSLFVEEMAGNIVEHGKPRNKTGICVDYRLYADKNRISLCLRDFCEQFDPMKYYEIHRDDTEENIGIRMVMNLAKDIRYIYTFNTNCLYINLTAELEANE